MSYFAVLHETPGQLSLESCHINLWRSNKRRRHFLFLDVGLGLKATGAGKPSRDFKIALPFPAMEAANIGDRLKSSDTASLVFGQSVGFEPQTKALTGVDFVLSQCSKPEVEGIGGGEPTLWKATILDELSSEHTTYIRLRFAILDGGSAWLRDRAGGELFDFRIADSRGAVADPTWKDLENQIVPILGLNAFVITPAAYLEAGNHPEFRYVRVLEPDVWQNYLAPRAKDFKGKMIVRHWAVKPNPERPIERKNPFTGFLQLRKHHGKSGYGQIGSVIGFFMLLVTASIVVEALSTEGLANWKTLEAALTKIWKWLLGLGVFSLVAFEVATNTEWAAKKIRAMMAHKWLRPGRLE